MIRVQPVFTGMPGLPGVSTMYFTGDDQVAADAAVSAVGAFYEDIANYLSSYLTITMPSEVYGVNEETGLAFAAFPAIGDLIQGESTEDPVANATQAVIRFSTTSFKNGRRVLGRTNVPGLARNFLSVGQLNLTARTGLTASAEATLGNGGNHVVWSRPTPTVPGESFLVNSYTAVNELGVLRSRRD